jgi:hypothetical protein
MWVALDNAFDCGRQGYDTKQFGMPLPKFRRSQTTRCHNPDDYDLTHDSEGDSGCPFLNPVQGSGSKKYSTHPRLGLPSGLFPSRFPTNIL